MQAGLRHTQTAFHPKQSESPMHIETILVQLSDPHIVAPGRLLMNKIPTAELLAATVQRVRDLQPAPTAVVVTGDLVDDGSEAAYAHLKTLLSPLSCPVFLMPGNHDAVPSLRAAWPEQTHLQTAAAAELGACYEVTIGGLRMVALDSTVAGAAHGELGEARLAWLAECLASAPEIPTVVALHHPPFVTGIGHMDGMGLRVGREAFWALVAQHRQVQRVIAGHLHRSISVTVGGVLAMTAPSTAHQISLDLRPDGPPTYAMEPAGFLVHHLQADGALLTHIVAADDGGGPRPFG